jgi:mitogen-activated protein kinase 15
MVRISAFQAGGLGSIPGWRIFQIMAEEVFPAKFLSKFKIQRKIGRGMRSLVWQVNAKDANEEVFAVKKIFSAFQSRAEAQRTYRELSILSKFNDNPVIVGLYDIIESDNDRDLYVLLDYMSSDLGAAIKSNALKPVHRELVMWQLLSALKYIHSAGIVHRAVGPMNILIDSKCNIKLTGFSRARSIDSEVENAELTDYISSRWYRSPEQLLASKRYSSSVDIWAAGCVLAEMVLLKPLFSGTSTISQLDLILTFCGRPQAEDFIYLDSSACTGLLNGFGRSQAIDVKAVLGSAPTEAQDLIQLCLKVLPDMRITATEALEHPYVNHFHNPDDEPVFLGDRTISLQDETKFMVNTYRDFIYADFIGDPKAKTRAAAFLLGTSIQHDTNELKEV